MLKGNNVVRRSTLSKQWQSRSFCYMSRCHSGTPTRTAADEAVDVDLIAPSKLLPTSPLLDAAYQHAREKASFRQSKPLPKPADTTDFQRRLAANPYAHALATRVRHCSSTRSRLPTHFLLGLAVEFKPDPTDPSTKRLSIALRESGPRVSSRSYLLNSSSLVERVTKQKTWKNLVGGPAQERFNTRKFKDWDQPQALEHDVLRHLRQSVYAKMKWAFSTPTANLIIIPEDTSGDKTAKAACILHLKLTENTVSANHPPLPKYNLHTLLGEHLLIDLLQDSKFASAEMVMLADSHLTTAMRLRILKLQAFLDHPLQ